MSELQKNINDLYARLGNFELKADTQRKQIEDKLAWLHTETKEHSKKLSELDLSDYVTEYDLEDYAPAYDLRNLDGEVEELADRLDNLEDKISDRFDGLRQRVEDYYEECCKNEQNLLDALQVLNDRLKAAEYNIESNNKILKELLHNRHPVEVMEGKQPETDYITRAEVEIYLTSFKFRELVQRVYDLEQKLNTVNQKQNNLA